MTQEQEQEIIAPASLPQELFINSDADITIASGSAGSSKSYSILLRWFRYVDCPHSRGVIFRRTSTQLTAQGGLWEEALSLFSRVYGKSLKISIKNMKITFPTGASLQFSHYENEQAKEKFKGLQADYIAFDEMTEFTEEMVVYLRSRNRNAKAELHHKACLVGATNPHCDSFLKDWVWWWLDPITGIPDPAKRGIVRYFVKQRDGSLDWYGTREEAEAIYGSEEDSGITSMCVIGSTVYDNPYISKAYIGKLKEQSRVEQDRLLHGSWTAREESSGYFKKDWLGQPKLEPDRDAVMRVRSWDLAASLPSDVYPNPDWTAGVLMSKSKNKTYLIEHVTRFRDLHYGVEQRIIAQAYEDGKDTIITLPKEVGSSGQSYINTIKATLVDLGFTVKIAKVNSDKVSRFAPFCTVAESGLISYVTDAYVDNPDDKWNDVYFNELEVFDGTRKHKRDQVDATSDAFNTLRTQMVIPAFSITSFTTDNPFVR